MKRFLLLPLLLLLGLPTFAQFQGVKTIGFQLGPVNGVSGLSITRVMDERNAFQFLVGYTGLFAPNQFVRTTVATTNELGQAELTVTETMPEGYRNSIVVGGTYQLALITGNSRSNGHALYMNIAARGRVHLDRPAGQFDSNGYWITPEVGLGLGANIGLGERWELFAEVNALYYNADDNPVKTMEDPDFLQWGTEVNTGLRYRITW